MRRAAGISGYSTKTGLVLEGAQQNWRDGDSDSMESDSLGTLVSPVK